MTRMIITAMKILITLPLTGHVVNQSRSSKNIKNNRKSTIAFSTRNYSYLLIARNMFSKNDPDLIPKNYNNHEINRSKLRGLLPHVELEDPLAHGTAFVGLIGAKPLLDSWTKNSPACRVLRCLLV